jgi:hypothetical protein
MKVFGATSNGAKPTGSEVLAGRRLPNLRNTLNTRLDAEALAFTLRAAI